MRRIESQSAAKRDLLCPQKRSLKQVLQGCRFVKRCCNDIMTVFYQKESCSMDKLISDDFLLMGNHVKSTDFHLQEPDSRESTL